MKQFDTLVFIGRFQPLHIAHVEVIRRATELAKQVVIVVGSANEPRTYKNPFTVEERIGMLSLVCKNTGDRDTAIRIESVEDHRYNDTLWATDVQKVVLKHVLGENQKIGIIGHDKDESTFYLKMFPQWERVEVPLLEPLNASEVRELFFRTGMLNLNFLRSVVPDPVLTFLANFAQTPAYDQLIREREFIAKYKKAFESLPYPPVFVTVDAVVVQSGHVLLIKRKAEPGRGLWALPGGFLNANSDRSVQDAMIRELEEETGIKVPTKVLAGNITASQVFDKVDRDPRGRVLTHAFKITLPDGVLPRVKGADDAEKAKWVPIAEIVRNKCYSDHIDIIKWALGAK